MKLYFYTANTINGYCNKLGVVVTVFGQRKNRKPINLLVVCFQIVFPE